MTTNTKREETYKFIECDTCRAKSGAPRLCEGCLYNRETIHVLLSEIDTAVREREEELVKEVEGLKKFHGAKFFGPSEQFWVRAKMISNSVKKEVWNAAIAKAINLIQSKKV